MPKIFVFFKQADGLFQSICQFSTELFASQVQFLYYGLVAGDIFPSQVSKESPALANQFQ
jgi:hypothetical protein